MNTNHYYLNAEISSWLDECFENCRVANIRFHLNHHQIKPFLRDDFCQKMADRFRHNYSRHFYRGVRRSGMMAKMFIYRHKKQSHYAGNVEIPYSRKVWDTEKLCDVKKYPYLGKNQRKVIDAPHLHILAEIPEGKTIEDVKAFVFKFCTKPRKDYWTDRWGNEKWLRDTMSSYYVAETDTVLGAGTYNAREGHDSLLQIL